MHAIAGGELPDRGKRTHQLLLGLDVPLLGDDQLRYRPRRLIRKSTTASMDPNMGMGPGMGGGGGGGGGEDEDERWVQK